MKRASKRSEVSEVLPAARALVADLTEPTTGTVTVNGKTARQARLDQDYGIAFQQAGLLEWLTVAENVAFGPRSKRVAKASCPSVSNRRPD